MNGGETRPPIDPAAVRTALGRFTAINAERLRRTRAVLGEKQRPFLDLLPLLFHVNDPTLPGFVSELAPAGVAHYRPGKQELNAAKAIAKGFRPSRKAPARYRIHALYIMGSAGSIAQSGQSDLDMWVCVPPDLEPRDLEALQRKCWALEGWAETLGVEAHFFLVEAGEFKAGIHGMVTEESSGSAQHHLLLDEFYRTALLVAGRHPLWWLVPPEWERAYEEAARELTARGLAEPTDVLDFGGLEHTPAGEFYGAALWQLYKGIDSPYKSLLKILVMERYAAGYPDGELLSQRMKRAVYRGDTDPGELDPYELMGRLVGEYLMEKGDAERLELARRGFYYKVGERLSARPEGMRAQRMQRITEDWAWDREHLRRLDGRPEWKADRVMEERRALVGAFTRAYWNLSEFARRHADEMTIGQSDLALLGNKLHAAFERKAGKVERINPGISEHLAEEALSFHRVGGPFGTWLLFRGEVSSKTRDRHQPIKRFRSLLELLAWCHFNRLIAPQTALHLHPAEEELGQRELRAILRYLEESFPDGKLAGGGMAELGQAPRVLGGALFINIAVDPMEHYARRGIQVAGGRPDPLCYGPSQDNLVLSCDMIAVTSWKEILTFRHTGETALLDTLCEHLSWAPPSRGTPPPKLEVHSYSSPRGPLIARRVGELLERVRNRFYKETDGAAESRFLVRLGRLHYLLHAAGDAFHYQRHEALDQLLDLLAAPRARFSPITADGETLRDTPLPLLFEANRANKVQLFYLPMGPSAWVYVLDERGSLFRQEVEYRSDQALLSHFERFFFSVLPRRHYVQGDLGADPLEEEVEYYRIDRGEGGGWRLTPRKPDINASVRRYFNLQVIGEQGGAGQNLFTIYCDDREFSTLEHGERLFQAVAEHLLARRQGGERYPIYVTDVDIGQLLSGEGGGEIQTIHFLNHKRRIEESLNEQLAAL